MKKKFKIKKEEGHKVAPARFAAGGKAQSSKGEEKNSVPLCLSASVPNKKGFTLIELMAVIAIIMILSAILIPNVVRHMERSRNARAEADMDVLVKAVSLFQIDHDGSPPEDLEKLWSDPEGPYISTPYEDMKTPWGGTYKISAATGEFTITAEDSGKTSKISKTIKYGNP
jgi:prepilin-type N-terminal cleavage/methylation domain-containing protein